MRRLPTRTGPRFEPSEVGELMKPALKWSLIALVAALVVAAALVVNHRLSPKHFRTVAAGVLYRSATLPPEQLAEVVADYGIRTVVNVRDVGENARGDWHARQAAVLEAAGVGFHDLPMHTAHPPSDQVRTAFLRLMADPAAHPVLVHCEYGVVRSGMMAAVYRMEFDGASNEQAWDAFLDLGDRMREGPDRDRVRSFILGYRPEGAAKAVGAPPPRLD